MRQYKSSTHIKSITIEEYLYLLESALLVNLKVSNKELFSVTNLPRSKYKYLLQHWLNVSFSYFKQITTNIARVLALSTKIMSGLRQ